VSYGAAWWRRAIVASEMLSLRSGEEPVEDDGNAAGCGNRGRGPLRRAFMQAIGEEALSGKDGHPRGPLNVLPPAAAVRLAGRFVWLRNLRACRS
jgi:hypothetical protein